MKLKKIEDNSNTLGIIEKREFSIDTSNQMIVSILRDRLYKNKVGAVCREVSSNCRDANREAGRELIPINIEIGCGNSLLDENKLFVSFGDSGIGINPDRIENVFLKYGSSTKRDSNNQTGGFGIGAKTPFAYNNEFIIETVTEFQGSVKKYIYQAIILTENGVESSQLILVSENDSKEKLGTKIIVPIKLEDRNSFEREIFTATSFWSVKPNYKGFEKKVPNSEIIFQGNDWKVLTLPKFHSLTEKISEIHHQEFFILVDGIPYENPGIEYKDTSIYNAIVRYNYSDVKTHPILEFKTGELTLSASREEIEQIDSNLDLILARVLKMEREIFLEGEKMFKDKKTKLDKISFLNRVKSQTNNNPKTNYLNSLKFHENIESLKDLPITLSGLFGVKSENINLIEDTTQVRCVKKNRISELETSSLIYISNLKKWNIIIKNGWERMNYKKSETLRQQNKPILFVNKVEGVSDSTKIKIGLKLLKEAGIKTTCYSEVVETKVKRKYYKSNKPKQEKDVRTLYAREFGEWGWCKNTFKYNKVSFDILEGEIKDVEKTIFLSVGWQMELKDLDLVKIDYDKMFRNELKDTLYNDIPIYNLLLVLKLAGYNIVATQNNNFIPNTGMNVKTAVDNLLKEKEMRQLLRALLKEQHFKSLTSLTSTSSDYIMYNTELGKSYLMLANFNIKDYKVIDKKKVKNFLVKENPALENNKYAKATNYKTRSALSDLANIIKEDFKMKKFEGYLTSEILDNQEEIIKISHPSIHYLFQEISGGYSWSFGDYAEERGAGLNIMKNDLLKLIKNLK